jgi:hypothetical protein
MRPHLFISGFVVSVFVLCSAIAPVSSAHAQVGTGDTIQMETPVKKPKVKASKDSASSSSLEARHKDCLAFIQRHGLSCDPWETPTCGYDIGYARPLTCVAP